MPTCRLCFSVYPREQFIHGNGPRAQVCVRCGVEQGMVTEEEAASLYEVDPWGLYTLIILAVFTLIVPIYMLFFSSKHMAVMARLTPEYERPEGH